jgi:hypothetical protein
MILSNLRGSTLVGGVRQTSTMVRIDSGWRALRL